MKNRKTFVELPSEEMMGDVVGTKVLYNWLYQKEEENYYINEKVSGSRSDYWEDEALFVESASFAN